MYRTQDICAHIFSQPINEENCIQMASPPTLLELFTLICLIVRSLYINFLIHTNSPEVIFWSKGESTSRSFSPFSLPTYIAQFIYKNVFNVKARNVRKHHVAQLIRYKGGNAKIFRWTWGGGGGGGGGVVAEREDDWLAYKTKDRCSWTA